jgi:hypothetical protein
MTGASGPLTFHLIPHTHWDREWYLPRAAFLPRLVVATGNMLDLLERDSGARFVLDGQTILVEDALAVEPGWAPRVAAVVAQRQLEVGPWYILADELIPSGESLVRNLLQGARDAHQLGARMDVMYSPDAFGHPGILPTLAYEFGIHAGVIWRGLGDRVQGDLGVWRGPDGAAILLYHLPMPGYEIGAELAGPSEAMPEHWRAIRQLLVDRAVTSHVAVFVGADHHAPPQDASAMCDRLQRLEPEHRVRLSGLHEYLDAVREALEDEGERAPVLIAREPAVEGITGELRWSHGYTWTLQGVHATRSRLKRQHTAAELLIARNAEVLIALAASHGGPADGAMLRTAWRTLLQCQFHDTLCGCCSDAVAHEQESRLGSVFAMGRELVRSSLHLLSRHDADAAREQPDRITPTLLVWNPVPRTRGGIVTGEVTCFRRDIVVGPPPGRQPRAGSGYQPFILMDMGGASVALQVLSVTPGMERIDAARHYPDQDAVDRVLVAFDLPPIPGLGLAALAPKSGSSPTTPARLDVGAGHITNRYIEVHAGDDGRVDLVDRRSGERYTDVLRLVDERDLGDSYTPWIPPASPACRTFQVTRQGILANGPLLGAIETHFTMRSAGDGSMSGRRVLIMHADSRVLRVRFELENSAIDHRLRLSAPVGAGDAATAGAAFGFERRESVNVRDGAFPQEQPVLTAPAHRYVAAGSADRGLALLCPGFFEYEWTLHRELILTVLRSVGELSRNSLPTRPGHAGWPMETPEAQEPGRHELELALAPLGENEPAEIDALERLWEDTFLAPQPTFIRDFTGSPDQLTKIGVTLEGDGLVFTSLKPAESGQGVVLRCYNTEPGPVPGRWLFPTDIGSAHLVRADECSRERIPLVDNRVIAFIAPARGIVTIQVSRPDD